MGRIKLVITDLDGTFLDNPYHPNKTNIQALRACEAAGVPVRAITARSFTTARALLALGGFSGISVHCNGASLYDIHSGEMLLRKTISQDQLASILGLCVQHKADVKIVARDFSIRCNQLRHIQDNPRVKEYTAHWPSEYLPKRLQVDTMEQLIAHVGDDAERIILHAPHDKKGFDGIFYRSLIELGEFSFTSSHPGGFDIMAGGVYKSAGAQSLADIMGVQPEEVLACGDHNNDIGMLRWAGIGVAMGDAHPDTKRVADYVSVPHDKGGVADAINRFVL